MPQLTLRGITPQQAAQASRILAPELAALLNCPEDYFTFDCLAITSFFGGEPAATAPFIDLLWFDRGKALQDQAAVTITEAFRQAGVENLEICFRASARGDYYGDGVSYDQG